MTLSNCSVVAPDAGLVAAVIALSFVDFFRNFDWWCRPWKRAADLCNLQPLQCPAVRLSICRTYRVGVVDWWWTANSHGHYWNIKQSTSWVYSRLYIVKGSNTLPQIRGRVSTWEPVEKSRGTPTARHASSATEMCRKERIGLVLQLTADAWDGAAWAMPKNSNEIQKGGRSMLTLSHLGILLKLFAHVGLIQYCV